MKKYISVLAIIFIISLAACSNQTISSTPTGNESNIQSNSITTLDKGIWPVNEYTEGLPIPPGTVAWATLDTEHENCNVNLTGTILFFLSMVWATIDYGKSINKNHEKNYR